MRFEKKGSLLFRQTALCSIIHYIYYAMVAQRELPQSQITAAAADSEGPDTADTAAS